MLCNFNWVSLLLRNITLLCFLNETFYDNNIDNLDDKTKNIIETFINKMDNNTEYKEYKKKEIKLIIYNNRDKVSKEIIQNLEVIV